MHVETIDTHEAIRLFHEIMQPTSPIRVVRLIGDGKMGKSHLLTRIFPPLARQNYQARYTILDLRNRMYTIPDVLHLACEALSEGHDHFDRYYAAHHEWGTRLKVNAQGVRAVISSVTIIAKDSADDVEARDRELTSQFVKALSRLDDRLLLLFIDSINNATESMQKWLMDQLLVSLSQHAHVRIIVAGRTLLDAHGSYAACCQSFQLQAIRDEAEYIAFCQKLKMRLQEQSIRDIAEGCNYIPGMFAEFVYPKFTKARV